nr:hypothetical protein [uncultured Mediterranean phage uvMED]BAR26626.1 hypothetical protein [uncultured Mediterranean phage uvMED]BAR26680.1 hypothetical protein [uncultured Mediterranean phage uvMED]BAR26721.1 hypothetical protein [uncultured Mediterranean phage uvMED]BAR26771.1 hypothetical protein [uncultured Mediterranean phage uvMED]
MLRMLMNKELILEKINKLKNEEKHYKEVITKTSNSLDQAKLFAFSKQEQIKVLEELLPLFEEKTNA